MRTKPHGLDLDLDFSFKSRDHQQNHNQGRGGVDPAADSHSLLGPKERKARNGLEPCACSGPRFINDASISVMRSSGGSLLLRATNRWVIDSTASRILVELELLISSVLGSTQLELEYLQSRYPGVNRISPDT